jgi:REP element-mobilizing transposase RayT
MGRDLRHIDPEYPYHVGSNGNNRGPLVLDRTDCLIYREELNRVATKYEWKVFSWCLMPTHTHVILQTTQEAFSAGFQELNGNHSRRTNARHDRRDHTFRHRPWADAIVSDAHLVAAVLYVARNPLAAGIVRNAAAWPYGSYRAIMGLEPAPRWLAVEDVLQLFGRDMAEARRTFATLVHAGLVLVSNTGVEGTDVVA